METIFLDRKQLNSKQWELIMEGEWKTLFNEDQQSYRLLKMFVRNNKVDVWQMVAPRTMGGLGLAQYTGRIKEIRKALLPYELGIGNVKGRYYFLINFNPKN